MCSAACRRRLERAAKTPSNGRKSLYQSRVVKTRSHFCMKSKKNVARWRGGVAALVTPERHPRTRGDTPATLPRASRRAHNFTHALLTRAGPPAQR